MYTFSGLLDIRLDCFSLYHCLSKMKVMNGDTATRYPNRGLCSYLFCRSRLHECNFYCLETRTSLHHFAYSWLPVIHETNHGSSAARRTTNPGAGMFPSLPTNRALTVAILLGLIFVTITLVPRERTQDVPPLDRSNSVVFGDGTSEPGRPLPSKQPWLWFPAAGDNDNDALNEKREEDAIEENRQFNLCRPIYNSTSIPIANATEMPRNVSLIIFGDSVDRYMIADWCRRSRARYLCGALGSAGREKCDVFEQFVNATVPDKISGEFAFVFCRDVPNDVALLLVHNRFATDPNIASSCKAPASLLSPTSMSNDAPFPSPEKGWKSLFLPFLRKSAPLLGRPADSILIQSLYWDFLKTKVCSNDIFRLLHAEGRAADQVRKIWVSQHTRNATILMRSVVSMATKEAGLPLKWAGWRTSTLVTDLGTEDGNKWRWPKVNELIKTLNAASARAAREVLGLDVFFMAGKDGEKGEPLLRDAAHPNPAAAAQLMQDLLLQIGQCTSKPPKLVSRL